MAQVHWRFILTLSLIFAWGIGISILLFFLGHAFGRAIDIVTCNDDLAWNDRDYE